MGVGVGAECCFTSTETVGLLWTGAHDDRLDFHTALSSVEMRLTEALCDDDDIIIRDKL